jgi:hypothetical protein
VREKSPGDGEEEREICQERDRIQCGNELFDRVVLFNLMVKINGSPVRDLIEPSP